MSSFHLSRRDFARGIAFGAAAFYAPGAFAEALTLTPSQTEGPFYPDHLPLDTDNDLLIINDSITPAIGDVTHLTGKILDADGKPLRNALVEIWQVDGNGVYLHSRSAGEKRDANFQGYGRFHTGSTGEYYFRTVKPVQYPGRTPHIHYAISQNGKRLLTTQLYVKGSPRQRPRRRPSRHSRRKATRVGARRVQTARRFEARRVDRRVPDRAGLDA